MARWGGAMWDGAAAATTGGCTVRGPLDCGAGSPCLAGTLRKQRPACALLNRSKEEWAVADEWRGRFLQAGDGALRATALRTVSETSPSKFHAAPSVSLLARSPKEVQVSVSRLASLRA